MHGNGTTQQTQGQGGQDDTMAGVEMRAFGLDVDVGRDDSVEIAPADDYAQDDSALVDAVDVVGDPGERVGDARVDAHGAEEGPCVLNAWVGRADQHAESDDCQAGYAHAEISSEAAAIREPTGCDSQNSSACVGRHRKKLRMGSSVAHTTEDGGEEEGKCVKGDQAAHVDICV